MTGKNKNLLIILILCLISLLAACNKQPENTETVFNKRFIPKIKPMMQYEQLVKIIGKAGAVVKDANSTSPQIIHYHWDGGKSSTLDAMVESGKLVDATVLAPNGNTYRIGNE
jgi:hypothetical protein